MGEYLRNEYEEQEDNKKKGSDSVLSPKVSIIIPVYKVEKYIRQALDSVVNQTLKEIEIICVNDCTPDNSFEIVKEYAKSDKRFKIIDLKENGGLGNARNVAIKEVTSECIMFLDSDDWLETNACELAYKQVVENNNSFVIFGSYIHSMKTKKKKYDYAKLANFSNIKSKTNAKAIEIDVPFWGNAECWYKIYNAKFFKENNLEFDKGAFEDQRFNVRLFTLAESFSVLDKPLYNYRKRKNSITAVSSNWKDFIAAKKRAYELIKEITLPSQKLQDFFVACVIKSVLFYFCKYTKSNKNIREAFYLEIHKLFLLFSEENDISKIKDFIDYEKFNLIIESENYNEFSSNRIRHFFTDITKLILRFFGKILKG